MPALRIGDRVMYSGAFGSNRAVPCTITGYGTKNGRVVYDNDLGH